MGGDRFSHRCSANTSTIYQVIVNTMIIKPPDIKSYWKTSWISEVPFFKLLMPRNRFQEIVWVLHVSHSNPCWPAKRIDMIKQLLQLLIPKFREHYYPSKNLAIDETVVGFCGRFDAKPYAQKTLSNWASRHSTWLIPRIGIFFDTLVYTGAETLKEASPESESLPQSGRVVMHLMRDYLDSNHHVYRPVVYKHTCNAVTGCSQHLLHWHCHEKLHWSPRHDQSKIVLTQAGWSLIL